MSLTGGSEMAGKFLKNIGNAVLLGLAVSGAGYAIAVLVARRSGTGFSDVLFIEGFITGAIGLMMSMKGNPAGTSLQGLGLQNANQLSNVQMDATQTEREKTSYYRDFLRHAILEFSFISTAILLGGVFLILLSFLRA